MTPENYKFYARIKNELYDGKMGEYLFGLLAGRYFLMSQGKQQQQQKKVNPKKATGIFPKNDKQLLGNGARQREKKLAACDAAVQPGTNNVVILCHVYIKMLNDGCCEGSCDNIACEFDTFGIIMQADNSAGVQVLVFGCFRKCCHFRQFH